MQVADDVFQHKHGGTAVADAVDNGVGRFARAAVNHGHVTACHDYAVLALLVADLSCQMALYHHTCVLCSFFHAV